MNGWTNYETWNVSLWIQNDEELYRMAVKARSYTQFVRWARHKGITQTDDGIRWGNKKLNKTELDNMIKECA